MNIHQLQVAFDAAEDRVLFRLSTTAGDEFRVFLTRRFVKLLWPHLLHGLESKVAVTTAAPEARREVLAFEHDRAIREADFSKPFAEARTEAPRNFPLGDKPFVAAQGNVRVERAGAYKLTLNPAQGRGVEIGLDDRLMHSFCRLLESAVRTAEWDLELSGRVPEAGAEAVPAAHLLN
ncbi:MAG TPA: hypothetical protein VGN52_25385 [Burkholderiales bacterium]|jgi:hypothetical protein